MRAEAIAGAQAALADPSFQHRIVARYPLERIAEAHEAVESGKLLGNVVVTLDQEQGT